MVGMGVSMGVSDCEGGGCVDGGGSGGCEGGGLSAAA